MFKTVEQLFGYNYRQKTYRCYIAQRI